MHITYEWVPPKLCLTNESSKQCFPLNSFASLGTGPNFIAENTARQISLLSKYLAGQHQPQCKLCFYIINTISSKCLCLQALLNCGHWSCFCTLVSVVSVARRYSLNVYTTGSAPSAVWMCPLKAVDTIGNYSK